MRTIAVFLADTHAGHRLGLMKPGITLYQEDKRANLTPWIPNLTATQHYLWECYQEDIQAVADLAQDDPIIVHHVGDLTQGKKYKHHLVSSRTADQLLIARSNLTPWLQLPNVRQLHLIVGTRSHIFSQATSPILVKEMLQPAFQDVPMRVIYHTRPTIDGVIVDAAHHGPSSGIREWTQGNQLRYYAKSLLMHDILRGKHPPALIIRAHFHRLWPETVRLRLSESLLPFLRILEAGPDAYDQLPHLLRATDRNTQLVHKADIVLLPSYCGMGEYGRQATGSSPTISNGLLAAEIVDGQLYKIHYFERELDIRSCEVIQ